MRVFNRIAAALLGLVLIAVGLLAALDASLVLAGLRPWPPLDRWFARWSTISVGDPLVLWISVGVGVVGLLVLLSQLRRWRPDRIVVGQAEDGWWLTRRSVQRRAATAASTVVGVRDVRARLRGGRRLKVEGRAVAERADDVRDSVREELGRLTASGVRLDVKLREPVRRVA